MKHTIKEFATTMEAMADVTNTKLSKFLLELYVKSLEPFGWDRVNPAMLTLMEDLRRFPTISEIKQAMGFVQVKPITGEDLARDAVSRIWEAIAKFGWCNPKEAQEYIGELGWKVVERFGGWGSVTDLKEDQRMGITAQMRDLAVSLQKFAANGIETGPALPKSDPVRLAMAIIEKGEA